MDPRSMQAIASRWLFATSPPPASARAIMAQTGHRSERMVRRYIGTAHCSERTPLPEWAYSSNRGPRRASNLLAKERKR